jgi:hypothetical protein
VGVAVFTSAIFNSERWRRYAGQMRALAQDMRDPAIKANILRIAEDYDRLAQCAEERSGGDKSSRD